jgi:hypothetical protein
MDQQKRTAGAALTGAIMFFCAFIFLCLGAGMTLSYPDKIWVLGLILLGCAAVMIVSGIANLRLSGKIEQDSKEQLSKACQMPAAGAEAGTPAESGDKPTGKNEIKVLARWNYSGAEWNRFLNSEKKERKTNSTLEAIGIVVLGVIILRNVRDASWELAIGVSGFIGVVYWLGKYFLSMGSIGKALNNEVIVTNRSVIINNKVNTFNDGQYWLKDVTLKEETDPAVIEFIYEWQSRNPNIPAHDEIRIPVPKNKIGEAKELLKQF